MKDHDVRFIRKGGRIIPIKVKKKRGFAANKKMIQTRKRNKAAKDAGLFGLAGFGLMGASYAAGKKVKTAARLHEQAFKYGMDEKGGKLLKRFKSPASQMDFASKKLRSAGRIKSVTKLLGAGAIGVGVERLADKYGLDERLSTEYLSELAGIGAALGSEAAFEKGAGVKLRDQQMFKKAKKFGVKMAKGLGKIRFR
jgi:hypothetical protein